MIEVEGGKMKKCNRKGEGEDPEQKDELTEGERTGWHRGLEHRQSRQTHAQKQAR